jgi:hypothetical protein
MRFKRTAMTILAVSALIVAMAAPALAGKPTKYDLTVPDGYYGETVIATASSGASAKTASPGDTTDYKYWRVLAMCYQDGELVFKHYALFDGTYSSIPLGPTRAWQEGPADCTAELGYFHKGWHTRWRSVDSTTFSALWPVAAESEVTGTGETTGTDATDPSTSSPQGALFTIL